MDIKHLPVELTLDQCIKCNICTTACPVSAVTDLFPGPKYEAPQAQRFRKSNQDTPDMSVDYCTGCRVCNMVCPTGVKIAEINAKARADLVNQGKVPPIQRLRNNLVARAELLGKVAQPIAPIANLALNLPTARMHHYRNSLLKNLQIGLRNIIEIQDIQQQEKSPIFTDAQHNIMNQEWDEQLFGS